MQFFKIQALGNDFVIFGSPNQQIMPTQKQIKHICDRHYGVGCDCAVFISKSNNADYFMHVFNPDGFEAEICGNALRCSAQYISECGYFKKKSLSAETLSGTRSIRIDQSSVTTEIGKANIISKGQMNVHDSLLDYTYISMGNPHCVIFLTYGLNDDEFTHFGKAIEHHPLFPDGANVEFICITDNNRIVMRVWERGIGETKSCSTGSCAAVAAAIDEGLCSNSVQVYQPGGMIEVETRECGNMFITGKCKTVFKGDISLPK